MRSVTTFSIVLICIFVIRNFCLKDTDHVQVYYTSYILHFRIYLNLRWHHFHRKTSLANKYDLKEQGNTIWSRILLSVKITLTTCDILYAKWVVLMKCVLWRSFVLPYTTINIFFIIILKPEVNYFERNRRQIYSVIRS